MKILVTGATGFLGSYLSRSLREEGHRVATLGSKDADLTREGSLDAFDGVQYDQIYHLAAWTQAGDFCLRHPGEQWIINQKININVLDWWANHQPQAKMVAIGTSCSYPPDQLLKEDNYLEGQPIESLFAYAMTKRMLYAGLVSLSKQFSLSYLHLVPSTLYGSGYHTDERQMHFIFDLVRKIIRGKKFGEPVVLWGDGHQRREIIHVLDFVRIAKNLSESTKNETVNIGSGQDYSIREFAKMICDAVEYDFDKIQFDETKYVGARSKVLDVRKLKEILPNISLTDPREGIKELVAWFLKSL